MNDKEFTLLKRLSTGVNQTASTAGGAAHQLELAKRKGITSEGEKKYSITFTLAALAMLGYMPTQKKQESKDT